MKFLILVFSLAFCLPAFAAERMSAEEFDRYTQGKTLFYGTGVQTYGAERYLPNRRVQWSFLDGECKEGAWYEANGMICFVYDDTPDPQCWSFEKGQDGLIARFENDPTITELYEARSQSEELVCLGPKIGV